jgi:hypothetical protein
MRGRSCACIFIIFFLLICPLAAAQQEKRTRRRTDNSPIKSKSKPAPEVAPTNTIEEGGKQPEEEILTNDSIVALIGAGLDEEVIVAKIRSTKSNFDVSTESLITLNKAGVSKRVIKVMIDPKAPDPQPQPSPPAEIAPDKKTDISKESSSEPVTHSDLPGGVLPIVDETGFYLIEGDKTSQILGSGFSQAKAGGFLSSAMTYGIKKVKVKAVVRGSAAAIRTRNKRPLFFIYAPDGITPTDYLIIRLDKKDNKREIVVGSGGLIRGASAGFEDKNIMPFSSTKLAMRKYLIKFEKELSPGEYGFYPVTGVQVSGMAVNAGGKLYDFGIDK